MAAIVRFSTNKPVTTAIRIKDGEWERELIYDATYNPEEGLPVVGLVPDRTHELRVFIHDDFGRLTEAAEKLEFHSLSLPMNQTELPPEMKIHKLEEEEPGILLLNLRRRHNDDVAFSQNFGLLIALNTKGKVVWYYRSDSQISDFKYQRNGNLIYKTQDDHVVEIDWLGNIQAEWNAAGDEFNDTQPTKVIAEVILKDTSVINPVEWTISGVQHLPYIIPCNYCYAYPGPPRPRRRPF